MILFIFNNNFHKYSKRSSGMLILNIVLYIKYVISIFFIIINKDYGNAFYTGRMPLAESNQKAIVYILLEMFFIFITIFMFAGKIYKNIEEENTAEKKYKKINCNPALLAFIGISSIIALLNFKDFLPIQMLFVNDNYAVLSEERNNRFRGYFLCS